jgi:FixJ family two-component response regulator
LELIRTVRDLDADVPIIVLTGHRSPGWVPQGALKCIDKPVPVDLLIETLRSATLSRSGYQRAGLREIARETTR